MLVFIDESGKPHPKDSTENPVLCAVCIADIFAGIIRHYYENGLDLLNQDKITDPFESWLNNLFLQIKRKTENLKQDTTGFIEYGFYKIGNNF